VNPTLYDILGVRPDAAPEEIKRAWRDAADRFQPGAGSSGAQFRLFNEAAEVLLDPARRAEYDARLAEEGAAPAAPVTEVPAAAGGPAASEPSAHPPVLTEAGDGPVRPGPALWVLTVLALVALALAGGAAAYGVPRWRAVHEHDRVTEAGRTAPAAAERAAAAILSYDYKSLDSDEKAAERYMTAGYAKKYAATFDKLVRGNAERLHARVEADVRASGVSHADADRVNVLLFVNQTSVSTANGGQQQTALNRVQLAMVRQGGSWVVGNITSY
jgi:Mce-associated membrane protein